MTQAKHLYIAVALVILALIGACAFISSKVAVARAEQVRQDMKPVHEEAAAEKKTALKSEDANQKLLAATLAAIATQKQQPVATPVDYARIEQMIEQRLGAKAEVQKPAVDPAGNPLPDSPGATVTTDARKLRDYMLDCDARQVRLEACEKTVGNVTAQLTAEVKDHEATRTELEITRKAMKGGSFWQRAKSNSKWFVVGGIVTTAVVCGTGHCK